MRGLLKNTVKQALSAFLGIMVLTATIIAALLPVTDVPVHAGGNKAIMFADDTADNISGAQESNVYFGNYYQRNSQIMGPVEWRVLYKNGNDKTLLLLSDKTLDTRVYSDTGPVTWAEASLRYWLNGIGPDYQTDNFIGKAFSGIEQNSIKTTRVRPQDNPDYETSQGDDISDKIFILNIQDVLDQNGEYGFSTDKDADDSRIAQRTGYAKGRGGAEGHGYWWLRSSGYNNNLAANVSDSGEVDTIYSSSSNSAPRNSSLHTQIVPPGKPVSYSKFESNVSKIALASPSG